MDKSFYVLKHNIITSYVLYILSLSKYIKHDIIIHIHKKGD